MSDDRESLRATFDAAAASYAEARPTYPDELIDALASWRADHVGLCGS